MGFTPKLLLKEIYAKGQNQWWQFRPSYVAIRSFDVFPGALLQASRSTPDSTDAEQRGRLIQGDVPGSTNQLKQAHNGIQLRAVFSTDNVSVSFYFIIFRGST